LIRLSADFHLRLRCRRIEDAASHSAAAEDALPISGTIVGRNYLDGSGLKKERVFVSQFMHSDGEADDGFAVDGYYAAAVATLCVERQFDAAFHAKRIQLALYRFDKWFGLGELFDRNDASVERGRWLKRAGDGKAETNLVTADIQALSGEWKDVAVMVRRNAQAESCAPIRKRDQALSSREAADQFDRKPIDTV